MKNRTLLLVFLLPIFCTSCIKYKDIISYENSPGIPTTPQQITNFKPVVVQPNDILQISVSSLSELAAAPFNSGGDEGGGYLVDANGNIELPTLGTIQLENLTIEEVKEKLKKALAPYFSEAPIVNVRLANFKINVNGEVGKPGIFNVPNGRMTMIEAITLAGDFTSYSRRDSILVVREFNNERTFGYIDFNSAAAFESPYFYLQQNDVIYIKPSKYKTTTIRDPATRILPFVSLATGVGALLFTIFRSR
jgi:polysaccharide export outer membrane protein